MRNRVTRDDGGPLTTPSTGEGVYNFRGEKAREEVSPQSVDKGTKRVSQAGSRRLSGESVPKQLRTALFGRGGYDFTS